MKKLVLLPLCLFLTGFATSYNIATKNVEPPTCNNLVKEIEVIANLFLKDFINKHEEVTRAYASTKLEECNSKNNGILSVFLEVESKKVVNEKEVKWCTKIVTKIEASLDKEGLLDKHEILNPGTILRNEKCE